MLSAYLCAVDFALSRRDITENLHPRHTKHSCLIFYLYTLFNVFYVRPTGHTVAIHLPSWPVLSPVGADMAFTASTTRFAHPNDRGSRGPKSGRMSALPEGWGQHQHPGRTGCHPARPPGRAPASGRRPVCPGKCLWHGPPHAKKALSIRPISALDKPQPAATLAQVATTAATSSKMSKACPSSSR